MSVDVSPESGRRSYLPGAWFGVFGEHATVLLPPSEKRRVAALWELLDDGADFDEVLDALIATGLRDLPGFVLLSDTDGEGGVTARVVVRGDARVSFETTDGPVEVLAAGAGTWVERTVPGVTSTVLEVASPGDDEVVPDPADATPMTLTSGLVRVSRVQAPPAPAVAGALVDEGPDTDPMVLPADDRADDHADDHADDVAGGGLAGGHGDIPATGSGASDPAGLSPAVVAGSALGAAGLAGAAGVMASRSDHEAQEPPAGDAAVEHDAFTEHHEPAPAPEPEPEPAHEPLAEADPATEAFPAPVDHLDPATPVEHHDEPQAEPARTDDEVGEPTEMMSFDELAGASEQHAEQHADQDVAPDQHPDQGPADDAPGHGGWEPAEAPRQDGPPPAPDFGNGSGPAGAQWSPPPAPANPFAPGGGDQPGDQGGYGGVGHEEQPAPYDAPQDAPQDGGWGRPDPAPGWGEPAQAGHADVDHDGDTRAGEYDPEVYARSQPGIPGQPPAPSVTSRPVARLMMSHGESIDVDRAILVGRAPEARRFTATEQPRLVTVPSPNQEISSTHLEVRPGSGADHGSAVVTDMGSTNGTVLIQPGLAPEDLQPGVAVQLIPGAVIDLGDGLTIQVANP
ncbi:FHA domain-containing protein [uncultured Nocardioides sp.]|uniref:FHA domain-containing protein n=1 Tax=uncultured Nocardioides sp. TaxID=198441 RepID=UPI002614BCC7|nr:FHA domain-containing protein [uncultured Nocardioides sp.]